VEIDALADALEPAHREMLLLITKPLGEDAGEGAGSSQVHEEKA